MNALIQWIAIAAVAGLAMLARYLLVEPAAVAHLCDTGGGPWWCGARAAVIATFSGYGLGYAALGLAALALALRRAPVAWAAAATGAAALVLYCFEAGAVGLLVGVLVLARAQRL